MSITSVAYTDAQTGVAITMDDGSIWIDDAARPPDSFIRQQLAEWLAIEGNAIAPFEAPLPSAADLLAHAANARWEKETGGIEIGGVPVATDDRSKVMIIGARVAAQADPEWSTVWAGADGDSYPLTAPAMIAISDAVQAHVNSTFATFAQVKTDIEAGTITTKAQVDAAFA